MTNVQLHKKHYLLDSDGFFSPAEMRELVTWVQGLTVDESAFINHVSTETVKAHRRSLREKTEQHCGIGVLTFCLVHGYIRPVEPTTTRFSLRPRSTFIVESAVSDQKLGGSIYGRR